MIENVQNADSREADLLTIIESRERANRKTTTAAHEMRNGIAALLPYAYDDDLAAEVIRRGLSIPAAEVRLRMNR